eukprot:SAG31_NODE_901_length_11133_cov_9.476799_2_plen_170_part_00
MVDPANNLNCPGSAGGASGNGLSLCPGEQVEKTETNVSLVPPTAASSDATDRVRTEPRGLLQLTNFRLLLTSVAKSTNAEPAPANAAAAAAAADVGSGLGEGGLGVGAVLITLALSCIESLHADESTGILRLICKDVRLYRLRVCDSTRIAGAQAWAASIVLGWGLCVH